jgi:hypothetical protein
MGTSLNTDCNQRQMKHAKRPRITRHTSHVTRHTSHVTLTSSVLLTFSSLNGLSIAMLSPAMNQAGAGVSAVAIMYLSTKKTLLHFSSIKLKGAPEGQGRQHQACRQLLQRVLCLSRTAQTHDPPCSLCRGGTFDGCKRRRARAAGVCVTGSNGDRCDG